jgi:hypothetical protein
MASLQDLPTELLIEILISCPTTRTLLRLSSINRRMRAVWLEHSKHIIVANYKQRIPHIEQAIALTLIEVQCGEIPKSPEDHTLRRQIDPKRLLPTSPEFVPGCSSHESHSSLSALDPLQNQPSIGLYLPRVLRNAGLASSICDKLSKHWQEGRIYRRSWQPTEDPYTDSVRAYYFLRHLALASDHPQLQPAALSAVSSSSYEMLEEYDYVYFHMESSVRKVWGAHAMRERNWDSGYGRYVFRRDPETPAYRMTDRWRRVQRVLAVADYYLEIGSQEMPTFDVSGRHPGIICRRP